MADGSDEPPDSEDERRWRMTAYLEGLPPVRLHIVKSGPRADEARIIAYCADGARGALRRLGYSQAQIDGATIRAHRVWS